MRLLPITKIVLHHSAGGNWESIKARHKVKGWGDNSAYHFFIEKSGELKEGKPTNQPSNGTRSWKANHSGIHICVSGNFEIEEPTKEQIKTLRNLIQDLMNDYKIKPKNVKGHLDFSASACPGKNLYSKISDLVYPGWALPFIEELKKAKVETDPSSKVGELPLYQLAGIILKLIDSKKQ